MSLLLSPHEIKGLKLKPRRYVPYVHAHGSG